MPAQKPAWARWLRWIGAVGTLLAATVLVASMTLRLETSFALDGAAISSLAPGVERAIRLVHRLAASSVALLALAAAVICWIWRAFSRPVWMPVAWIGFSTLMLSVIGPMTPGYRLPLVTVANVSMGMLLLMAFWWLRETAYRPSHSRAVVGGFERAAMVAFVLHAATGAAASAALAQGGRLPVLLHLLTLTVWLVLAGSVWRNCRRSDGTEVWSFALLALVALQLLVGYLAMVPVNRTPTLLLAHALISPLLALCLVSLAVRRTGLTALSFGANGVPASRGP